MHARSDFAGENLLQPTINIYSEALYNMLMQAPVAIVVFKGANYIIELTNDHYLPIAGKTREELLNKPAFEVMPIASKQGFIELMDNIRATGEPVQLHEYKTLIEKNGTIETAYLNIVYQPLTETNGTVERIMILVTDVTEQVLAKNKLVQVNRDLQYAAALTENIADAVIGTTTAEEGHTITSWNKGAEMMYGWKAEEVLGKPAREILQTQFSEKDRENWDKIFNKTGNWRGEVVQKTKNGEPIWVLASIASVKDNSGNIIGAVGVNRDITERKKSDEKLSAAQRQLNLTIENVPSSVYLFDNNAKMVYANKLALKHLEKLLGSDFDWDIDLMFLMKQAADKVVYLDEHDKPIPPEKFPTYIALTQGKEAELLMKMFYRETGEVEWFLNKSTPVLNESGQVEFILSANTDFTAQKVAEEKVRLLFDELNLTFNNVPSAIYHFDKSGKILYLNHKAATQMGYTSVEEVLAEKDVFQFRKKLDENFEIRNENGEVLPVNESSIAIAIRTGEPAEIVSHFISKKDQKDFWIISKSAPIKDENGEISMVFTTTTDITAQKEAEAELVYQKRLLETVTENTDMALLLMDDKQYCVYMNEAAEQMTGFTLDELKGRQLHYYVHHSHPDGTPYPLEECPIDQALPTKKRMKGEEVFVHKNGSFYPVSFTASPIVLDDRSIGTVIEVRDTTEEKKKEEAIRESEERFRSTFETAAVGIAHVSLNGQWLFVNKRLSEILSYPKEELQELTFQDITHPDDLQTDLNYVNKLLQGEISSYSMEKRYLRKDGSYVWANLTVSLLVGTDNKPRHFVVVVEDISAKKVVEEKMRDSEELFRTFSNNITNLAWIADGEGWIYWYNQRWFDYTGTTLEDMEGWGWGKVHHPDHIERVVNFVKDAWKVAETWELTFPLRGADGTYKWFLTRAVPVKDKNGEVVRWIGTNTDIDEQKKLSENLEALVNERTKELQRSNDDLQQFAHVTSHDLKEPVRKVGTFANRLLYEFGNDLPEKAKLYVDKMEKASERMYSMIDGVLLYSSLGAAELVNEQVDLNEIIVNIQSDLEVIFTEKNATLEYENLPTVSGSAVLIYQLFYNLIYNSLKFAKAGVAPKIKITAGDYHPKANESSFDADKKYKYIIIEDNGIGFDAVQSEKIFKPFARLHSRETYEGTGLGLALCKKIVERHKGQITAKGQLGLGATFSLILPSTIEF